MAAGDSVAVELNEEVEVTFKLDYKKALVARLPDHANFDSVVFVMSLGARSIFIKGDARFMTPPFVVVKSDDQDIKVTFNFTSADDPDVFRGGDAVGLLCVYGDKNGVPPTGGSFQPHLLGTANIKSAAPAPSTS